MKGVLIILDGVSDIPHPLLKEKTPLESAETPNLDFLAGNSEIGLMYPVKPKFTPESDEAIISLFGNSLISSSRGQLEAKGADLDLKRGDLAFRVDFGTIDNLKFGNILDRRAGRTLTTLEAQDLAKSINKIQLSTGFIFEPTIQHRAVLVLKGGFSDAVSGNDFSYSGGKFKEQKKIQLCEPLDEEDLANYTSKILNEFLEKSFEVLNNHPVNKERKKKGLLPANYLFIRGAGIEPPKLKQYPNWISLSYMPLEIGFSKLSGMKVVSFNYPPLNSLNVYENLRDGLKKACEFFIKNLKKYYKKFDYIYIHIKETDLPGHDDKPIEKRLMIEYIDKTLFGFLRKVAERDSTMKIVVTADHTTACILRGHSFHPVPVLLYNHSHFKKKRFCEKDAKNGTLGRFNGSDLFKVAGFYK